MLLIQRILFFLDETNCRIGIGESLKYWSRLNRKERETGSGMTEWELLEGKRASSFAVLNNPSDKQFNQPDIEDEETEALRCEVMICPQETHKADAQADNLELDKTVS